MSAKYNTIQLKYGGQAHLRIMSFDDRWAAFLKDQEKAGGLTAPRLVRYDKMMEKGLLPPLSKWYASIEFAPYDDLDEFVPAARIDLPDYRHWKRSRDLDFVARKMELALQSHAYTEGLEEGGIEDPDDWGQLDETLNIWQVY